MLETSQESRYNTCRISLLSLPAMVEFNQKAQPDGNPTGPSLLTELLNLLVWFCIESFKPFSMLAPQGCLGLRGASLLRSEIA